MKKNPVDNLLVGVAAGSVIIGAALALVAGLRFGTISIPFVRRPSGPAGGEIQPVDVSRAADPAVRAHLEAERWEEAIPGLERDCAARPGDEIARQTLALALHNAAVKAIAEPAPPLPRLQVVAAWLDRSAALSPGDSLHARRVARAFAALGLAAYQSGQRAMGRQWADEALRRSPDEPYANYVSGAIFAHEGSYAKAEPLLMRGREDADAGVRASASEMLERVAEDVRQEQDFAVHESGRFTIRYEGAARPELASRIVQTLERKRATIADVLGRAPSGSLEVIVYTSSEVAARRGLPDWVGAVFDGRIRVGAAEVTSMDDARLEKILGHEYTHASIHDILGRSAPVWFEEGLAQVVTEGAQPVRANLAAPILAAGVTLSDLPPEFVTLPPDRARAAYALSYATVAYIIQKYGNGAINLIMNELSDGKTPESAIRIVCGLDLRGLEKAVSDWLSQG